MLISMITQRDLAKQLGLTQAAVSMALRGSGRISAATRERVRETAQRLGWQGDPSLSALSRRRWAEAAGPIAYLGTRVAEDDVRFDRYWLALRTIAREQGLRLHHIDHRWRGDAATLAAELRRLGVVHGVLVGQDNRGLTPWQLDWERYSVVHCGLYAMPGPGDVVCADLLAAPAEAVAHLAEYGRIAAIMPLTPRSLSEQMLLAALQGLAHAGALTLWTGAPADLDQAVAWLHTQHAGVVLGYGDTMADQLQRRGVRLPIASLAINEHRTHRGACIPYIAIAHRALAVLHDKVAAGQQGIGTGRSIHLVPMPWRN